MESLKTNTSESIAFLQGLHPDGPWHVCAMPADGRLKAKTLATVGALRRWIDDCQGQANVYFHVNQLRADSKDIKAKKEDIVAVTALHVDVDVSDEAALEQIRNFKPAPSIIVSTGGGYHGYWLLKSPSSELERAEQINATLARRLGGDNCQNIDRLMRVPGTLNLPNKKKRARGRKPALAFIREADWQRRYSLSEFPTDEPDPGGGKAARAVAFAGAVAPRGLDDLPSTISDDVRRIIEMGDDPDRPRGSEAARYPSRSEAVFGVCCNLVRAGCTDEVIAGILINPALGIAESVLEKKAHARKYALRQAASARSAVSEGWPDVDRYGNPKITMRNAATALQRLGLTFEYDLFRHRKMISGHALEEHQGEITDDACMVLRGVILGEFGFDPKSENVRDAVTLLCLEHPRHPVREMLEGLRWDGVPRIDRFTAVYLGAEETPLNAAISHIMLIAAVRRVRQPGVKFDQIIVLEGEQGTGKSSALKILAGPENHSDQEILTADAKQQMELMEGVWIYELGEVEGLNRAEVNKIKAFASRTSDRARPAYGRHPVSRLRQAVFIGTTNEEKYLRDQTGNRRFWPVRTGVIDLAALERDRDQLWAEAAAREAQGESIVLPRELWESASVEQSARLEEDPWLETLAGVPGHASGDLVQISTWDLLTIHLEIPPDRQHQGHSKRLATTMRKLGWEQTKFRDRKGKIVRGYQRPKPDDYQEPEY